MLDINASAEGGLSSFRKSSVLLSSTASKRPALRAHNAHHFGRGEGCRPRSPRAPVDSIEKAARRAECVSEMAATFD